MLSIAILSKNEEENLKELLPSLSFAQEILIIDAHSYDQTVEVAKKHGARVISSSDPSFSNRRNKAMHEARNNWVLFIDADERLSQELINEIQNVVHKNNDFSYRIPLIDVFWGQDVKFGEVWKARTKGIMRLVKKGSGEWRGDVHEEYISHIPVLTMQYQLKHYSHASIADFLTSVNEFSTLKAKELYFNGHRATFLHIALYPCTKFLYTYFILLGFLDGAAGFVYSFMMSFHSFLVMSKLYLLQNKNTSY
ncbi:hypothetical protein A3F32_01755 [Candidatus Roizmanbacteria bacterium RIFCSPHIGHO2_12_FULL_42_10]|uniref:Glycosyltransferase 2-like domain-containing protein n=1 Tax=Candidatus Roizmanbacteria bacterium RIFCSPHIGHO2_12_FULL_42_10 TaxID=1802053 RepID=A0A1F7I3D4_9BACT|nr:MAG: hypothetical protein A3F32_01755 [Candidatus Roizmanbacteria bacterium RIFCSPHIGHO2_12_FULL_42_10]